MIAGRFSLRFVRGLPSPATPIACRPMFTLSAVETAKVVELASTVVTTAQAGGERTDLPSLGRLLGIWGMELLRG